MNNLLKNSIQVAILNFLLVAVSISLLSNIKKPVSNQVTTNISQSNITSSSTAPTKNNPPSSVQQKNATTTPSSVTQIKKNRPIDQLPDHNKKSDCWILYAGNVYNVTSYLSSHPGGTAAIVKYCGKDATTAFNTMDKSPPSSHSATAKKILSNYLIK